MKYIPCFNVCVCSPCRSFSSPNIQMKRLKVSSWPIRSERDSSCFFSNEFNIYLYICIYVEKYSVSNFYKKKSQTSTKLDHDIVLTTYCILVCYSADVAGCMVIVHFAAAAAMICVFVVVYVFVCVVYINVVCLKTLTWLLVVGYRIHCCSGSCYHCRASP